MRLRANKFYEKARLAPAIACGPAKFFSSKSLLQRSKDPQDAILYCTELFSKYPNAFYTCQYCEFVYIQYIAGKNVAGEMLSTLRVGKVVAKHVRAAHEKAQLVPAIVCGPAKFFSSKSLLLRSKDPQDAILYCTELFSKYPNAFYTCQYCEFVYIQYIAEKTLRRAREMLATLRVGKVVAKHDYTYRIELANAARDHYQPPRARSRSRGDATRA